MFKSDINEFLKLEHNQGQVKLFIKEHFRYYTNLFAKIWLGTKNEDQQYPSVFFNSLNELDSQFMLILSACKIDDPDETIKIRAVSFQIDRLFSLLQLQGAYDSNLFASRLFEISKEIREQPVDSIEAVFNKHLILEISENRTVQSNQSFNYALFRSMSIDRLNTRFIRYLFGRVDCFLAEGMKIGRKHNLSELVTSRGSVNGFHVEHILSHNNENLSLFNNDEERFEQERNRLGGILLLKGKDNISSNNEVYTEKLKTYANTLYWNETLRADAYQSKLDFRDFAKEYQLKFQPLDQFGPNELEERQRLFDIASIIWRA